MMRFFGGLLVIGLAVAVLRTFNWDIFAFMAWVAQFAVSVVTYISDYFTQSEIFQNIFKTPA